MNDATSSRIFARMQPSGSGPRRPPRVAAASQASVERHVVEPVVRRNNIERDVVAILDQQPIYGESVQRAFDRKERELHTLFRQLTPSECAALHSRLAEDTDESELGSRWKRLAGERRSRIQGFLADAARRKASAS